MSPNEIMGTCSFTIPDHLIRDFEMYHESVLISGVNREFAQSVSILLKYSIGNTKGISEYEVAMIEEFFYRKEMEFGEFVEWILLTCE